MRVYSLRLQFGLLSGAKTEELAAGGGAAQSLMYNTSSHGLTLMTKYSWVAVHRKFLVTSPALTHANTPNTVFF